MASQSIKECIAEDIKSAMRARETQKLAALRLLLAAIKQKEIDEQITLSNDATISVIEKLRKQRRDSIEQYTNAGRTDLAAAEQFEMDLLTTYLPPALSDQEIAAIIDNHISAIDSPSIAEMGKIMNSLKAELTGKADMAVVSSILKSKLS